MSPPVVLTWAGTRRGMRACVPLLIGLTPFGLVCGIVSHGAGLSLAESTLMSGLVYSGSAQLVALNTWGHPAPILAAAVATLAVNSRLALMGPVLAPWFDRLRGWRLWLSLFGMADQNWALCVADMNAGGRDAGLLFGSGLAMWTMWLVTTIAGFEIGHLVQPPPGHPIFFAGLAVFVSMLAGQWRGAGDFLPWLVAAGVAVAVSQLLPGAPWFIVAGSLAGSLVGGVRDMRRRG